MSSELERGTALSRTIRKWFVSAFVAFSFGAYVVHVHLQASQPLLSAAQSPVVVSRISPARSDVASTSQQATASGFGPVSPTSVASAPLDTPAPTALPSPVPSATDTPMGLYRDGDYTGQTIDAYYGLLQVQARIQQGRLADVQILQYPNDRRTSIRINNVALPWLKTEVIQAQSANVDIISGATLTSEAYMMSLESALASAQV
jgi:uncharacterized protein with FMN-binding domain